LRQDINAPRELERSDAMRYDAVMRMLATIRELRGLSQVQLAEMAGCTQATISRIEAGKVKPGLDLIEALAFALNVPPGALFALTELQARVMAALSDLPPDQQRAALTVIEAMAARS